MKFVSQAVVLLCLAGTVYADTVKMCLHVVPSGHVRTDPIINQDCASDHVHTFYGPQQFRPETTAQDLLDTPAEFSSTQFEENKSLYWHPTIYQYNKNEGTYTRAQISMSSGYYRWDTSVQVMAFPPGFRMIAGTDPNVQGVELFSECIGQKPCQRTDSCESESGFFPQSACDEMGIAMQFPTCWNGELDDPNDHSSHMAYTLDGTLTGECPPTHQAGRFPQIQFFVRIAYYPGGWYTFSDESDIFHADFMNGWQDGKLQKVIDQCKPIPGYGSDWNPPCGCDDLVTLKPGLNDVSTNELLASQPCPIDTKKYIVQEEVDFVTKLPRGTCVGKLAPKTVVPFVTDCAKVPIPVAPPEGGGGASGDGSEDGSGDIESSNDVSEEDSGEEVDSSLDEDRSGDEEDSGEETEGSLDEDRSGDEEDSGEETEGSLDEDRSGDEEDSGEDAEGILDEGRSGDEEGSGEEADESLDEEERSSDEKETENSSDEDAERNNWSFWN